MAVKKTAAATATEATEAAGATKAAGVDISTTETEKAQNGANTAAETAEEKLGTVKMIYIGPTLPKAMLKTNRILEGTPEEIKKELATVLEKFPLVERLLVPVDGLAEKKDKVRTAGNILNKYYSDLVSAASAAVEKEV